MVRLNLIVVATLLFACGAHADDVACSEANATMICWNSLYPVCTHPNTAGPGKYQCKSTADIPIPIPDSGGGLGVPSCPEVHSDKCHVDGYCDIMPNTETNLFTDPIYHCCCPEGLIGTGWGENGCSKQGHSVRIVLKLDGDADVTNSKLDNWKALRKEIADVLHPDAKGVVTTAPLGQEGFESQPPKIPMHYLSSMYHEVSGSGTADDPYYITIMALYPTDDEFTAQTAADTFNNATSQGLTLTTKNKDPKTTFTVANNGVLSTTNADVDEGDEGAGGVTFSDALMEEVARVYTWNNDPSKILPTGMEVDNIYFDTTCSETGCWVVEVTFTVGQSGFNAFYLPDSEGNDALSYDFTYPDATGTDGRTWDIYEAREFPCNKGESADARKTAQCLEDFLEEYRPTTAFVDNVLSGNNGGSYVVTTELTVPDVVNGKTAKPGLDYVGMPISGLSGPFKDMPNSTVGEIVLLDPYLGQYTAVFRLDEKELRTKAGILTGTVGVEHTVDTFVGYLNAKPATGSVVLDALATQINLHFEKTSFFSVSTHGTNDYTFIEYVNLRLVTIYNADNFRNETTNEQGTRMTRNGQADSADYLQVTFTLGSKYVATENGLIPTDSIRVGKSTFFDDNTMFQTCTEYLNTAGGKVYDVQGTTDVLSTAGKAKFDARVGQGCGPQSSMCVNPTSIPDSFVSINLPLGMDWLEAPSPNLDNNVFVTMVVTAIDDDARGNNGGMATNPGGGEDPWQMKTTLSASIPVVSGGVNIFCDSITAKTDLKDVANVDIVVGSAISSEELTRLRILVDVATTALSVTENTATIDSASIEAGLLTFVLKGNASYFEQSAGTRPFTMELEDLITIHIMEPTGTTVKATEVDRLLAIAGDDNYLENSNTLATDGYPINGAFYFVVDRDATKGNSLSRLEPSAELLAACPFNPPRPASGVTPETCVIRRDVRNRRFPMRTGAAESTAIELPPLLSDNGACANLPADSAVNGCRNAVVEWLPSIFGDSTYTAGLAANYSAVIQARYELNGRYRRAFWINPGYEWTPTQTGGQSIFTVSQKIYLFALVTLDEQYRTRRRMLLQSSKSIDSNDNANTASSGMNIAAPISRKDIMASAFGVPAGQVVTYKVVSQLTEAEACLPLSELASKLSETFEDYLSSAASSMKTAQAIIVKRDLNGHTCPASRRSIRTLLADFSQATVESTLMVVFDDANPKINMEAFKGMSSIKSVAAVDAAAVVEDSDFKNTDNNKNGNTGGTGTTSGDDDDDDSSNSAVVIGAVCGGVGGLLVLAAGAVFFLKRRGVSTTAQVVQPSQNLDAEQLKNQLADV